jgi:small subunit ribosomal protein S12
LLSFKKRLKNYFNRKRLKNTSLLCNPQAKGIVKFTKIVTPRKPNSARRSVAKINLMSGYYVEGYIPGIGHNLRKHSLILLKGRGCRDLPGVRYKCIRGVLDLNGVLDRVKRRSIYGVPLPEVLKKKIRRKFRQN